MTGSAVVISIVLVFVALAIVLVLIVAVTLVPWQTYFNTFMLGIDISLFDLVGMNLRRVDPVPIVEAMAKATKSGLLLNVVDLEAHVLCNGDLDGVVDALIQADKANIPLDYDTACAIDLAGRNVKEAVSICISPIVISFRATGIAKDGIQLHVKIKVTLKAEIARLIGGATEATIQGRVIQGVISTIGNAEVHTDILRNPAVIATKLLEKGLDTGTAFKIVSVDIEDIDVGKNIGAHLQFSQAQADKKVAQAKAEGKRSMAIAMEYEGRAASKEMEAKLIDNQSLVPRAMVDAYMHGRLLVTRKQKQKQLVDFH